MARQFITPIQVIAQPTPSAPNSGFSLFAQSSSNALGWIGANGFTRTLDGTANTASRIYTLPDKSGTIALTSDLGVSGSSVASDLYLSSLFV